jgi:hypothetical protein
LEEVDPTATPPEEVEGSSMSIAFDILSLQETWEVTPEHRDIFP